ncbi:hypothetical protein, partial [Thioalkalivibrio denitrificans]|uniref:hypothetical protein n=1 Tax=Thioalkalivibrio denitrificans TaxID=108003 RepID=UPI001C376128
IRTHEDGDLLDGCSERSPNIVAQRRSNNPTLFVIQMHRGHGSIGTPVHLYPIETGLDVLCR